MFDIRYRYCSSHYLVNFTASAFVYHFESTSLFGVSLGRKEKFQVSSKMQVTRSL